MSKFVEKRKLIVIAGPTASGKTSLALELASEFSGEIINADSRQIYKYMDIGTNKGNISKLDETIKTNGYQINAHDIEDKGVKGWCFNMVTPDQKFTLAEYKLITEDVIKNIYAKGKVPILVGGTGLYVDSIIKNYDLDSKSSKYSREDLNKKDVKELQSLLKHTNPKVFKALNESDRNNPRRLVRVLDGGAQGNTSKPIYDSIIVYPKFSRDDLYEKINNRVIAMLEEGLIDEVKELIAKGYANTEPLNGLGYKQVSRHLEGKITYEEMVSKIQQSHRNYAKRQITWFERGARNYDLKYYDFVAEIGKISSDIRDFLNGK